MPLSMEPCRLTATCPTTRVLDSSALGLQMGCPVASAGSEGERKAHKMELRRAHHWCPALQQQH